MKASNNSTIILLGRSGSGKGTQANLLIKKFKFQYIESGNILRHFAKKRTFSGRKLKKAMEQGYFAPTFLLPYLWVNYLEKFTDHNKIIFDGSPRTLIEAELLDQALEWYDRKNYKVILIDISRKEAFRRLVARKRGDDMPEAINRRLDLFDEDVIPVVKFFNKKGKLVKIFSELPVEKVHQKIIKLLNPE